MLLASVAVQVVEALQELQYAWLADEEAADETDLYQQRNELWQTLATLQQATLW